MAESSSAIRIVPAGISLSPVARSDFGQQNPKDGASRYRLAFDDAAMIADDLCNQRQAEARATAFRGDEGIEDVRHKVGRHARAIVANGDFERQAQSPARDNRAETNAGPIAGRQRDLSAPLRKRG